MNFDPTTIPLKNITPEYLQRLKDTGLDYMADALEKHLRKLTRTSTYLDRFLTQDTEMLSLKEDVKKLMSVDDSVLITGETGTGKELIANALQGERIGKFVAFNCAGMPSELIESELFGHKKGAFTSAYNDKIGLFEAAKDGTLFMDEIGDLSLVAQSKILRAIQEQKVKRVGDEKEIPVNCRIVSATHKNLYEMVKQGTFREDLFYRVAAFELKVSPLRVRRDDITLILNALDKENKLSTELIFDISRMNLEGNVRQLQSMVRRYYVLGKI